MKENQMKVNEDKLNQILNKLNIDTCSKKSKADSIKINKAKKK